MRKLLSLLATGFVVTTSCLNTNYVFDTINFSNHNFNVQSLAKNKIKPFLYLNTTNNNLQNQAFNNHKYQFLTNTFETKNYNSVLLKSIVYDHAKLKLTSSLSNLLNYDLKHDVNKTDTYLDKIDYLNMKSMISKDQKESIITDNLVFLNHFFNDQSLTFNPNGYIASRSSLANTNGQMQKNQTIFLVKDQKESLNTSFLTTNNNLSTEQKATLNISWSGVYLNTGNKALTDHILDILNSSSSYINAMTTFVQQHRLSLNANNNLKNGYIWDSWSNERMFKFLTEEEVEAESEAGGSSISSMAIPATESEELAAFKDRMLGVLDNIFKQNPREYLANKTYYWRLLYRSLDRFSKRYLGFDGKSASTSNQDPYEYDDNVPEPACAAQEAEDVGEFTEGLHGVEVDAAADIEEMVIEDVGSCLALENIPIVNIIISLALLALLAVGIYAIVKTIKDSYSWKVKTKDVQTKGNWTLKQIWFNKKTRLFRKLTNDEIQFNGHFFKPWFGKLQVKATAVKPLRTWAKKIDKQTKISPNLKKEYNLITGTNKKFNLIIDPNTLKQVVASANLPNPQYNVKQVLALNKLNLNNLNLSNETWIKLIKEIKHPYLKSKYAAVLNYENQKLTYSNIENNQTTDFVYQQTSYLKEMIVGNNNAQDVLLNSTQLKAVLNDLENVKNEWNNKINPRTKEVIVQGIKNSNKYNPYHYPSYVAWYYYNYFKKNFWVDANTNDATNIQFLTRIFTKFRLKQKHFTLKESLDLENNNSILDLSSNQF